MPSVHCRKLKATDVETLWSIIPAYPELHWSKSGLTATIQTPSHIGFGLFDVAGTALSFACFNRVLDEAELLLITTHPAHLQQGYAATLIQQAWTHLQAIGVDILFLEVRASNTAARALYHKLGFKKYGTRPYYYQDGEAAILYRLEA